MGAVCVLQVHEKTCIVLFVHKSASLSLHRALLSRVAVVNSGFFDDAATRSDHHRFPHGELRRHYERRPAAFDSEEGARWLKKEAELLERTEMTFQDLARRMDEPLSSQQEGVDEELSGNKRLVCAVLLVRLLLERRFEW